MRLLRRLLTWSFVLLLVVLVAAAGGALWYVRAVEPQVAGTVTLPGFERPVQVVRDREGVPHIFAASEADAVAALGFVHAQDRLWQMEMNRRVAAGRLSEMVGAPALDDRPLPAHHRHPPCGGGDQSPIWMRPDARAATRPTRAA
jgi:penicillin amidase